MSDDVDLKESVEIFSNGLARVDLVTELNHIAVPNEPADPIPYREVLLETLNWIGCGGVVLDNNQNVIGINTVTIEIISRRSKRIFEQHDPEIGRILKQLLNSMSVPRKGNDWVTEWQNNESPLAIIRVPTKEYMVLVLVDIGTRLQPKTEVLQRIFGLTSAESKLALGLAAGSSPNELARKIGVRKTTVRTQLASVFAKTQTSRQGELVALLARIAILP